MNLQNGSIRTFIFRYGRMRGFTLIELLIAVAIIGILSSAVSTTITGAKNKAADAAIKSNLASLRSKSEVYNLTNNGYATATFTKQSCPTVLDTANGTNLFTRDEAIFTAITQSIAKGNGVSRCYASATSYGVAIGLKTSNRSWCMDHNGAVKQFIGTPIAALSSTGVCN